MRLACAVEYDGGRFHGWQRQSHDTRTVQQILEDALARVADEPVRTVCAGRTDAGVHAAGQVVHFDTRAERSTKAWVMGTNSHLPREVALRWARPVPAEFNARFSVVDRRYCYLIHSGMARSALWQGRAAWIGPSLDEGRMAEAAQAFIGEHDFSAFRSAGCQARNPIRRIHEISVERHYSMVRINVRGNAFLHNMVRIIVGTLISVGLGRHDVTWPRELLKGGDRTRGAATAPAEGLFFLGPTYPARFALPAAAAPIWPGDAE